ncbi:MAG TPA: von Willebrand factor type A domain-containing protein [Vicinamibacterales bacterium]|nr:von Willebrand factor type A domain-containing protein [Vicinamibacterales bacterium]
MPSRLRLSAVGLLVWALVTAAPSGQAPAPQAQSAGVAIDGSVVDPSLAALPGVTVKLLQHDQAVVAVTVTDAAGKFHFNGIQPGSYLVRAELPGFKVVVRILTITAERKVIQLPLVMEIGAPSQEMTVTAAAPVVDTKKTTTGATFTRDVQAGAGAGRGGSASGQQTGVSVSGSPSNVQWNLEGGRITDLSSNSSPSYYNFDSFEQIGEPRYWHDSHALPYPGESYAHLDTNRFRFTADEPVSTFGADVDTASFSNVRRFLASGQLPPRDAVRVEELVNYFHFHYADASAGKPVALTTEVGDCPWAPTHKLVLIGARARSIPEREVEGRNLVLLIDVSGSMQSSDKLPLIKTALGMFVDTLKPDDRLAIVTYAGTSGVALAPTPARERETIHRAIDALYASGSTNGGEGLITAYRLARQNYVPNGVNRVILATDGDFNVGITSQADLVSLIERERGTGVFLSVFGVGTGNLKDSTMEMLADRGNGHYAYLDSLQEARRVLIREADATLETVAKDVKFQVEFNPANVRAWKLIGYEDRALARQDFNDDRKDGGEMGAGHTVTVLFEIVPPGGQLRIDAETSDRPVVDPLKYQQGDVPPPAPPPPAKVPASTRYPSELLTVKVRYKLPGAEASDVMEKAVAMTSGRTTNLALAAAAAEFGLLLRDAQSPLDRWQDLTRRLKVMDVPADTAADRQSLADLVDLAAGLRRLASQGAIR